MILIDVSQKIPGFDKTEPHRIVLSAKDHSAPGYIKVGKKLRWTASIDDHKEGSLLLVSVEHDEALDPTEEDVKITHQKNYYVMTNAKTIVSAIITEMDDYHN